MADVQEAQTTTKTTTIEEYDLELSLGFRPLNSSSPRHHNTKNLPEPTNNGHNAFSKREEQAIRRHEAKVKRDLKRKVAAAHNGVVIREGDDEQHGGFERRRKVMAFASSFSLGNGGKGFRPYQGQNGKFNEGGDGEARSSVSTGSSSGVSDNNNNNYHSNSAADGNSSDTSCHSSHPHLHVASQNAPTTNVSQTQPYCSSSQETHLNSSNFTLSQPQLYRSSSNQTELLSSSSYSSKSLQNLTSGNVVVVPAPSGTAPKDRCSPDKEPVPTPRSPSPKEVKGVTGKPPKPNGQTSSQKVALPQMPCVSATGNGPMGKTITGFLYKYSKTEVSIVCVCHGTPFTPAGFVEHAGGVDVEHPLRHIRVVPFAVS